MLVYKSSLIKDCVLAGVCTAMSLLAFGICDYLHKKVLKGDEGMFLPWLNIVFVCTSTLAANWGVQTIPNLMSSTLFSPDVRPMQKSISRGVQSVLQFSSLLVNMFFNDSHQCFISSISI